MCECVVRGKNAVQLLHGVGVLREGRDERLVGVDPGGTTGVAWNTGSEVCAVEVGSAGPWGEADAAHAIVLLLVDLDPRWVEIEDYVLTEELGGRAHGGREALSPERIFGGIVGAALMRQKAWKRRFVQRESASSAKSTFTDDRLKRLGLYKGTAGAPHARDAVRHLLLVDRRLRQGSLKMFDGKEVV